MSDINIPGVTDQYGSQQMIQDLLDVEKTRLTTMETRIEGFQNDQEIWQDINNSVNTFKEAAKGLFGFTNPFSERIAESSDTAILTATAERDAFSGTNQLTVLQKASRDRFSSANIDQDYRVPSGTYSFSVGEEDISFRYRGGTLTNFAEKITEKGGDSLRASVLRNTVDSQIIIIDSKLEGASNKLFFGDDALTFALETGIIKESNNSNIRVNPTQENIRSWNSELNNSLYKIEENGISLNPGASLTLTISPTIILSENMVMAYESSFSPLEQTQVIDEVSSPGPSINDMPQVQFQDITIKSENTIIEIPEIEETVPSPTVVDNQIMYASGDGSTKALQAELGENNQVELNITDQFQTIYSLHLENKNTERSVLIENIRFYDPTQTGEYAPANAIETASNARLLIDGIEVERESNSVDDLIPGITLNIKKASEDAITLDITPDKETIKDKIINFVGFYNQLVTSINILTKTDETVIEEIDYFSDEEQEEAYDRLGSMRGDLTLMQLKSRLQSIMMNPYETENNEITLLAHMGISSNAEGSSSSFDATRLRGYLEINEGTLDQVLESDINEVKDLFGYDSDEDLIIDTGLGYSIDTYLKPYYQTGGFIPNKITSYDTNISETQDDIDDFNSYLEDYEADLKEKYGTMEGTLSTLQGQTTSIENLNNSLGGN